ncbi:hypothetical protein Bbelb_087970 [Branchiostoma belcheri]|nr:hypothetical protein Bbelb_087970 [Branchiostoma belcheri]
MVSEVGFLTERTDTLVSEDKYERTTRLSTTLWCEGQVSNGSCLQLADESRARRADVIKAELERNQGIRQLAASIPTGTSTSPSIWIRWGRRMPKCMGLHLKQIHAKATVSTVTLTQV